MCSFYALNVKTNRNPSNWIKSWLETILVINAYCLCVRSMWFISIVSFFLLGGSSGLDYVFPSCEPFCWMGQQSGSNHPNLFIRLSYLNVAFVSVCTYQCCKSTTKKWNNRFLYTRIFSTNLNLNSIEMHDSYLQNDLKTNNSAHPLLLYPPTMCTTM